MVSYCQVESSFDKGIGLSHSTEVLAEVAVTQHLQYKLALYTADLHSSSSCFSQICNTTPAGLSLHVQTTLVVYDLV